jgi:hypothetical protein
MTNLENCSVPFEIFNKKSILELLKNKNLFFMVYDSKVELRKIPERFFTSLFVTGSFNFLVNSEKYDSYSNLEMPTIQDLEELFSENKLVKEFQEKRGLNAGMYVKYSIEKFKSINYDRK